MVKMSNFRPILGHILRFQRSTGRNFMGAAGRNFYHQIRIELNFHWKKIKSVAALDNFLESLKMCTKSIFQLILEKFENFTERSIFRPLS